jgi:hypothetical protein
MAFFAIKTLFKILEKNLLKSFKTPLTRFNFLHKINMGVPMTSSFQASTMSIETKDDQPKNQNT